MPIDPGKYVGLFIAEAGEHLEALDRDLLRLEKERAADTIDSMFRHAHSVKGMAASLNFDAIAQLAHRVEDLVDRLRADLSLAQGDLIDLLLGATDHLQGMIRDVAAGRPSADPGPFYGRIGERLAALEKAKGHRPAAPVRPAASSQEPTEVVARLGRAGSAPAGPPSGARATAPALAHLRVQVVIAPQCPVPGVRAYLVHKKLSALGTIVACTPPLEDLKAGHLPQGRLTIDLDSGAGEAAVGRAVAAISDIASQEIGPAEAQPSPQGSTPSGPSGALPPAPKVGEPPGPRAVAGGAEAARTVRVRTELLDRFLDDAGELLLVTARLREIGKTLPAGPKSAFEEGVDRLHAIVKDLHANVMSVRLTPLAVLTERFPRVARDVGRKRGREVELSVTGAEIELDRAVLDQLADPLLHVLRNAIDHGIEDSEARAAAGKPRAGRVRFAARRERDRVVIELSDDGRGMDAEALKASAIERGRITREQAEALGGRDAVRLCLLPGVSTATGVSDVSGRGVGMDAVARAVENLAGSLEIDSTPGAGTRITLRVPLTVAVIDVLLVGVGRELYGLPVAKVLQVVEADPRSLGRSRRAPLLSVGDAPVPVRSLGELLGVRPGPLNGVKPFVVVDAERGMVALEVDRLVGHEETVLKPLSPPLDLVPGLSGVTILGTGRPIFILDVPRLIAT